MIDDLLEFGLNESFEDSVAEHDADYDAFASVRDFADPATSFKAEPVHMTTVYRVYRLDDSGVRFSREAEADTEALARSAALTLADHHRGIAFQVTREMVEDLDTVCISEDGE